MDEELQTQLEHDIRQRELKQFKKDLLKFEPNYKSVNLLKKLIRIMHRLSATDWGLELAESDKVQHKVAGGLILKEYEYYHKDPEYIFQKIVDFSDAENWNVRQVAVDLFEQLIEENVESWEQYFTKCVEAEDPHCRRLSLLTANAIARSAKYDEDLKKHMLDLVEDLIFDDDPYLVTVTTEVFGEGFMRNCPELTINWIKEKLDEIEEPYAKSTLVNITASRHTREYSTQALEIIDKVLTDDDPQVKKARSSALHNLAVTNQHEVNSFLESRLDIKQAVDHWAELEADGTLTAFDV